MFIRHKNLLGNSNVECYRIRASAIDVKFYNTNKIYTYSYAGPAGKRNVDNMKSVYVSHQNNAIGYYCESSDGESLANLISELDIKQLRKIGS